MDTVVEASTYVWGPDAWDLIHGLSFYPGESESTLTEIYSALLHTLPCGTCRRHARDNFDVTQFAAALKSDTLIEYWHAFHNTVNRQTKKTVVYDLDDLCMKYTLRGAKVVSLDVLARYARAQWILTPRSIFEPKKCAALWLKLIAHFGFQVAVPKDPKPIDVLVALDPATDLESLVESMALVDDD
jgi:hypothetical protein